MKQKEEAIINLVINGEAAKTSLKEVSGVVNALTAEIRSMHKEEDPKLYDAKIRQLARMKDAQAAMKEEIHGTTTAWKKFQDMMMATAAGVVGADAIEALMEKVLNFIPEMVKRSAQLSDELSDIQKTTGLTSTEVDLLNARLSKIDTRTASKDLREIAANAGQLGVAAEDVYGFTESIDKASVALSDEFDGGAAQVSNTLGGLRSVFKDIKSSNIADDVLHIANAMNVLGAEGRATSPVMADFSTRIGSVAIPLGLTSGQVLGLSATLQELDVSTERGSTAVVTILQRMLTNTKDFAKVAGMDVKSFKQLLDTDLYAAFNKVVEGAGKSSDSATGFAKMLDKLKIDGAGASQVISALSSNQDLLSSRVGTATETLKNQDSILSEFDLKNNNRAANLEKLGKRFGGLFSSASFDSLSDGLISAANKGIDVLQVLMDAFAGLIKLLVAATAGVAAYGAVVVVATISQRAWWASLLASDIATKAVMVSEALWAALKLVLTGRIREARTAMLGFNAVVGANPIGLMVAAIAAVVAGIIMFKDNVDAAADAQKKLNEISDAAKNKIRDEQERIEQLQTVIKDELTLREDKLTAIKKLRDILPDHLKGYKDEEIMAGKANVAVDQYIKTLERKAEAEGAYEELKKLKNQKRQIESNDGELNWMDWVGVVVTDMATGLDNGQRRMVTKQNQNKAAALGSVDAQIKAITDKFAADFKANAIAPEPAVTGGDSGGGQEDEEEDKIKRKRESLLEQSKQITQEYKNFSADQLNDLLAKNQKELKDEELKFDKMIQAETKFLNDKDAKKLLSAKQLQKHQDEADKLQIQKTAALHEIGLRQEKEMLTAVAKLRSDLSGQTESETQREYNRVNEFYDKQLEDAGTNQVQRQEIEKNRAADLASARIRAEERLQKEIDAIRDRGPVAEADRDKIALARINKKYDDEVQALKEKFEKELGATEDYHKALALIEKNRKAEIKQSSQKDEEDEDKKKKDALLASTESVANAIFQIGANKRHAETDAFINEIEKRREHELEQKGLTEKQKKAINDKADAEIKEAKLKAWQADRDAALGQAVIATALAVTKALPNVWAAAAAGIAGLAQMAVIKSEKPPKFYTGKRRASEGFAIVGDAGPELIEENGRLRLVDHEQLTYLQEGANVFNERETAQFMRGQVDKSVAQVAFDTMNASAGGVRFDNSSFSAGIDQYRFGSKTETASPAMPSQPAPPAPVDFSPLLDKFDAMIKAQQDANDKQVKFIYQDFEKYKAKIDQARIDAGQ
jgi:TP901 family phage tail tape measure protein